MFKTKYRVNRDRFFSHRWQVEKQYWWWPFWINHRNLIETREIALDVIKISREVY